MAQDESRDNPFLRLKALSVETELALLGAALVNPQALDVAAPFVDASDFSEGFLGMVWQTMCDLHSEGVRVTPNLVAVRISSITNVEDIKRVFDKTPFALLAHMTASAITVIGAPDYAKVVREMRHRRDLNIAGERLMAGSYDPTIPLRDVASEATAVIEQALNISEPPKRTMATMIAESNAALAEDHRPPGVTCGLWAVDRMIGGYVPGDLIVTGARPSMGKSATGIGMNLLSALQSYRRVIQEVDEEPWGVLFMTHEMTHEQVVQRCLTDLAFHYGDSADPVCYSRFRPAPGQKVQPLSWTQAEGMKKASAILPKLPIVIDGRPGMKVSELTALVRQHKKRFKARGIPLRVVTVDHIGLGKIMPDRKHGNRVDEIGEITSSLKALAVNEDVAVNALHQLSRANEGRENKRPTLADFRDSGHIEQDADVMVGLYRDSYYLERNKETDVGKENVRKEALKAAAHQLEYFVLKNRQGSVGMVDLWAHMGANAIRNAGHAKD